MITYFEKNNSNSKSLILFFCGWGMDETPFQLLKNNSDVLYVYDYTTPEFPQLNEIDFSKYETINLLAFSYGVYASAIAELPKEIKLTKSVAISGTLIPVDAKYGVPPRQFELTEKMDSESVVKFRQRLFGGEKAEEHFEIFEKNLPHRTAKSCTEELTGMKNYVPKFTQVSRNFDKVIIAMNDRCVPTRNQLSYWKEIAAHGNITCLETGHFPFYNYKSLEDILEL